ncbi:TonB-dependent siderophore receptor [Neisseria leonii]|uniref:TonB-dependent siderophore receptor n=1 Tax=Neisseria leonii TaxID=2995413 RepID=A0A9X4E1P1_9NEIS|nr:TonB-dependent siderophore receptor [Neisseria sp. 51.81]MDD9327109.1 TonB-dependent siderophore receptor [Neisseria sp. 51.81]
MKKHNQPAVLKTARKRTAVVGVGILAAAMNPAFAETQSVRLDTVNVKGGKVVRSGYKAPNTTIGKRMQDIQNIPQSATVINRQVIQDQATTDLKSTLKNAGITFQAGEGGQAEVPIIRGMHAGNDVYDDGLRGSSAQFNSDTYNTERVEVLKGSAAVLFGRGAAGGVINQVNKSPYIGTGGEVAAGIGTQGKRRVTADINHAFNDDIAVRLNVMGDKADSFRKPVDSKRWGIAPSIAFGLSGDTQLELSYKHDNSKKTADFGVPYLKTGENTRTAAVEAVDQFYGFNTDFEDSKRDSYTAALSHKFNDNVSLNNNLRYSRTRYRLLGVPPRLTENKDGTYTIGRDLGRGKKTINYDANTLTNNTDVNFKFNTGDIKHDLLVNLELTREKRDNYRDTYSFFNKADNRPVTSQPWRNLKTLTPGVPADDVYFTRNSALGGTLTTRTVGVGINDIVELTPTLKAVAGVRFNSIKTKNTPADNSPHVQRSDTIRTYNGSLIWDYRPGSNVYASYNTAATPVAYRVTGQSDSLDPSQLVAAPEKTRTIEIGTKNAFFDDALTVNAALFHTKKTQQYYRDAGFIDWAKVYGLDLEVAGRVTDRFNVLGNVIVSNGKMRATSRSTTQLDGHFPEAAAKVTANVWGNYRITDQFNTGLGLRYVGDRYTHMPARGGNGVMKQKLPAYTAVDAMVSYENRNFRAQLNANNVLDKKYFDTGHRQQAIPGERRNFVATVGYKF